MDLKYSDPKKNNLLEEKLARLKRREEEDLAQILSDRYGIPYIDLSGFTIDTNALRLIPEDRAKKAKIAAFHLLNKRINVAVLSPSREETKNEILELEKRGFFVSLYVVSTQSLERAWSRYADISFATESKEGSLSISNEEVEKFISQLRTLEDSKKLIEDIMTKGLAFRISRIVEIVIASAIANKASDIHVEPEENYISLRFRLDGVLQEILTFDHDTYRLLLSRIKLLSGMKINIKAESQDGRFSVVIGETEIEIRSSVLPGNHGESIVMRLLDPNTLTVSIEKLGMLPDNIKKVLRELEKPNGMILNTGPTGSGKTTTLYSFLSRKKSPGIKIITIEDPIEYKLPGIVQTQVNKNKNYDFANGLRSSLRQDPDVIMVGEIRDLETAETAVHAALTGHLVFSTLHTNNAAGAFPRLIDLGVNPRIITSAITMVMAQRLVRTLCECKKEVVLSEEKLNLLKNIYESIPGEKMDFPEKFFGTAGCTKCNQTGYSGRIGVFEILLVTKKLEEVIQNSASEREIKQAAEEEGMLDMAQDAVLKILKGMTTIEETQRVVDLVEREGKHETEDPIEDVLGQ